MCDIYLGRYVWAEWGILGMVRHGRALTDIGYIKPGRHDQAQMGEVYTWVYETRETRLGPDEWGIQRGIRTPADTTGPRWVGYIPGY